MVRTLACQLHCRLNWLGKLEGGRDAWPRALRTSLLRTKDVPVGHGWLEVGNGRGSSQRCGSRKAKKMWKVISLVLEIHQKNKLWRICSFKTNNSFLYDLCCLAMGPVSLPLEKWAKNKYSPSIIVTNNDETEKYYVCGAEILQDLWANFIYKIDT